MIETWRTGIARLTDGEMRVRGYDVLGLMAHRTFTDHIALLFKGELPSADERALIDAVLVGMAAPGSGAPSCAAARLAASGNRASLSAAVAAGVLAIGDEHGGAGSNCMELMAEGVAMGAADGLTIEQAAERIVERERAAGRRLPGFGHRVHTHDPRTPVLFEMARQRGIAGNGVRFAEAVERALSAHGRPLTTNIDGALAALLHDMGYPPPAGRLIFIVGRVAGIAAEVAEEHAREKPMRIRIPVVYDGEPPRDL
jgi:citrate synthase